MAEIKLKGNPINTIGELPQVGKPAPSFTLTNNQLADINLEDFKGQNLILNIFPSIDTGVCATSTRVFNEKAANLENTKVLCISQDLPFALSRFCGTEGINNAETLSSFRSTFGQDYGLTINESGMKGLLSRAVVVIDSSGNIKYTEQVPDIVQEPNYENAINALNN